MEKFRRVCAFFLPLLLLTVLTGQAGAALQAVGPVDPVTTLPTWYMDTATPNGLALAPCLDQNGFCLLNGGLDKAGNVIVPNFLDPTLTPFSPITTTGPINDANFPAEGFYYSAVAIMPIEGGELANLAYVLEYAFLSGVIPNAGISFLRTDLQKMRNLTPNSIYLVTHPYGTFEFTTDTGGNTTGGGGVAVRQEDGSGTAANWLPPLMKSAGSTNIGPFLTPADGSRFTAVVNGATHTYLGNPLAVAPPFTPPVLLPAIQTTGGVAVTGSPLGTNFFRIERIANIVNGIRVDLPTPYTGWQTNTFALSGRVYTNQIPSPMAIDRVTYARDATSQQVDVFATALPAAVLSISGTGLASTPLSKDLPNTGRFFAHLPGTTLPTGVSITNSLDNPAVLYPVTLVDEVIISEALYNPVARTLTIKAASRDKLSPPTLTVPAFAAPNALDATGTLVKAIPADTIPPQNITVTSSYFGSATAPVSVVTLPPPPVAADDTASTNKGVAVTINVLNNDTSAGAIDPATVAIVAAPASGASTVPATSGSIIYTPTASFTGTETFTYTVSDSFGQISNTATVTVTVHAPPVAGNDVASAVISTTVNIDVIANDIATSSSINSTTVNILTAACGVTPVTLPVALSNGTVNFTAPAAPGTCTFTYMVSDTLAAISNVATVTVTVIAPPVVTSAAGPNGAISPAGVTLVTAGANRTYTITPNTGFIVSNLVVDGTLLPGAPIYTFTNVTADHYINAYFADQTFTVTASAGANGTITPAGASAAVYGSAVNYAITPNPGFQIANLVVDGVTLPAAPSYSFTSITGNHTISAGFAPAPANLTVIAAAGPNGTISPAGSTSVLSGANQTYTITPNAGFMVSNLVVDGTTLPGAPSYTFTNVTADHYINAYFTGQTFTVTASAGTNGTVTPTGATAAPYGTSSSYTITPSAGFQVASLVVDGVTLPAASSYSFTSITGNHTISAAFTSDFTITASAGANGTVTPAGVATVTGGSNQTYTITPNAGFVVATLVVDGVTLPGATSYAFTNVTANHTISASFAPPPTITAAAGPNGTISPAGAATVTYGTSQTYTITPDAGFLVTNLVVDGTLLPGATSHTFTNVTADHYVNAYFGPLPANVTIAAAAAPNGTISPAGATTVAGGANQSYIITPDAGFVVAALSVDGTVLPGATSYTFTNVSVDHYINAYFGPAPATVTITSAAAANGTISPAGANLVTGGTNPTYTITPDAGFTVTNLVVDGTLLPGATSYTFTNVTADHYINAYFGP